MLKRPESMLGVLVIALLGGCLGPRKDHYESTASIPEAGGRQDRLWQAAEETLRHHGFVLDRVDPNAGVITTLHVTSQSVLEFWRHDVNTREDLWEATLNPIRRRVEVRFTDSAEGGVREVSVAVHKQRLSAPDRQFNSTGAVYQYFGDVLPSTTGKERVTAADERWVDIGRDPAMEEYLLHAMLERAGLATAGPVEANG